MIAVACILACPLQAPAQDRSSYVAVKGGVATLTGDVKKTGLDTGFNGEVSAGRYLSPHVALEAATAYIHDGVNKFYGNNVWVVPLTVSLKAIHRHGPFELYAGGGPGVYVAKFHGMVDGTVGEKWATVPGVHLLAGATVDLSRSLFAGLEGKLHVTGKADFQVVRSNLNSRSICLSVGCRF